MKIYSLLFLFAFVKGASAQSDEEILRKKEYNWLMAEFRLDTAAISAMMDEAFISISASGTRSKPQELEGIFQNMSERKKNGHVVEALDLEKVQVIIGGNTAVTTFVSATSGKSKVCLSSTAEPACTTRGLKDNEWKAMASQVTLIR